MLKWYEIVCVDKIEVLAALDTMIESPMYAAITIWPDSDSEHEHYRVGYFFNETFVDGDLMMKQIMDRKNKENIAYNETRKEG